ncbi:Hypp5422 [Branchiostoma lanceolatum]|uniref:Hypp5422 protein n=1 Tax=Branchiostoma lanceolatum TaxID=7740 RepID=A0A8J9WEV8_BRALA|nr:Hypp5422 [Branchiostoma lanceolatum]
MRYAPMTSRLSSVLSSGQQTDTASACAETVHGDVSTRLTQQKIATSLIRPLTSICVPRSRDSHVNSSPESQTASAQGQAASTQGLHRAYTGPTQGLHRAYTGRIYTGSTQAAFTQGLHRVYIGSTQGLHRPHLHRAYTGQILGSMTNMLPRNIVCRPGAEQLACANSLVFRYGIHSSLVLARLASRLLNPAGRRAKVTLTCRCGLEGRLAHGVFLPKQLVSRC